MKVLSYWFVAIASTDMILSLVPVVFTVVRFCRVLALMLQREMLV